MIKWENIINLINNKRKRENIINKLKVIRIFKNWVLNNLLVLVMMYNCMYGCVLVDKNELVIL